MHLYKRGDFWWFQFIHDGKRYRQSSDSENKVEAGKRATKFRADIIDGKFGIVKRKLIPTFADAMDAFLKWSKEEHRAKPNTTKRYKNSAVALRRFFGAQALDTITSGDVERFKVKRAAENATTRDGKKRKATSKRIRPATVNRELACMRAMYNHAIKDCPDLRNPVSAVKFLPEMNQQERVLTFAEQEQYLRLATPMLRDIAGIILETGMRPEEVYTLKGDAVNIDGAFLKVMSGKTPAARRRIELSAEAQRILSERVKKHKAGYLFPHESKANKPVPKINNAHDRTLLAMAEESAELKKRGESFVPFHKFRLYDLRHTWATRAAEAGIDLVTLASMLGHSRIQMVMRYAHPTQGHQTAAMGRLNDHVQARRAQEAANSEGEPKPRLRIVGKA